MSETTDTRECLQCGETKASIKAQGIVLCGIMSGYEQPELAYEFPTHRWADWRDTDLKGFDVKPEAYDKHRRTDALTFQWIACDDTMRGHVIAEADDTEFGMKVGQCWRCGKFPESHGSVSGG